MLKVAVDVSPLKSAHQFRGIGFYTRNLIEALKKLQDKNFQVSLFEPGQSFEEVDIVHYPYFDLFRPTLPLIRSKKTIVTVHDVIPLVFPKHYPPGLKGKLRFGFQKISLGRAEAVVCDSKQSQQDIVKFLNYPSERIQVVYLAPSGNFKKLATGQWKTAIKKKYGLPRTFVLYVGDVNYHKNVLGLVAACKMAKIPLVITGKQAAQKDFDQGHIENQPLVQLIKEYGKDSEVIRLGFIPDQDLVAIYNLATVYCQPSFYEGFGLSVLEAMACGIPVVSAKTGSLPEVVEEAALLVNPYEINDLADGLKKIIKDKKFAKDLVKKGIDQVNKFSWEKVAKNTLKVYHEVNEK